MELPLTPKVRTLTEYRFEIPDIGEEAEFDLVDKIIEWGKANNLEVWFEGIERCDDGEFHWVIIFQEEEV